MNDDLVKRLRFCANLHPQFGYPENGKLFAEAAAALSEAQATIARLEAALTTIANGPPFSEVPSVWIARCVHKARAALSPREGDG